MKQVFCNVIKLFVLFFFSIASSNAQNTSNLELGGSIRFNYRYKAWDQNHRDTGGDAVFDVFLLKAKANYSKLFLDAEYRFYPSDFGGGMLKHGFIGYKFNEKTQIQVGVNQVPFGILPYTAHSWFFNLPYYVGLEDDYDTGIKFLYNTDKFDFALAWYKNAEGGKSWQDFSNGTSGYGVDPARYSYDLAGDMEENGQFNARVAYKFHDQEIGVSGQLGRYLNHSSREHDSHYAMAIHYNGKFLAQKQLDVKLEALTYKYNLAGKDEITMAAYNYSYDIAKEASVFSGGIAYTIPVQWGMLESVQLYENYNYMLKGPDGFNDSQMNVVGMLLTAGPIYTYIDYASGKNHDWFGPWGAFGEESNRYGLGKGADDPQWHSWFNINLGYYF
ncbi:hypothetical protein DMA11_04385 [Marinilabiliaceae bacterium JC017]|nr:hypothetical protein DMA11_04385 [Marinilabiliaceae bacterium JC017]